MIRHLIFGALMWSVCIYAFVRGGRSEKIAAAAILIATYSTVLVLSPLVSRFQGIEIPMLLVDTALFLVLVGVSLKADSYWPLWLAAMQGLTTLSHFAPLVPHVIPWAYGNALTIWSYPMLIVLGIAIWKRQSLIRRGRFPLAG